MGMAGLPAPVLVVDDDADTRDALATTLEHARYRVLTAIDGMNAFFVLDHASTAPCLILLDLIMPVMNGLEFRERQMRRNRFADIPVVLMSSYGEVVPVDDVLRELARLEKPIDDARLLAAVARHCCGG